MAPLLVIAVSALPDLCPALLTSDNLIRGFCPASVTLVSKLLVLPQVADAMEGFATFTTNWKRNQEFLKNHFRCPPKTSVNQLNHFEYYLP